MYVIAGVSGNTGSVVARTLLAAKQPVRVLVRDAAKGEPWRARGAEVVVADLADQAALTRALTGATGAYLLLPPPGWSQTGIAAGHKIKTASLIGAVRAARPGHVVLLSSIGAELAEGTGPIKYIHPVEEGLRDSGVPTTFLRCSSFMENWAAMLPGAIAGGALYYGIAEGVAFGQVATEDIGEVAGKPIHGVSVPPAAMVQALIGQGASAELAESFGEMAAGITSGAITFHGAPVRGAITLEQRFRSLLAASA